jgi:type IV pilus assembly protein PilN
VLDSQLGDIQAKQNQIATLKAETKQVKDETNALASVFNSVKPWSAVMQDIRDRIPAGVQILRIKQVLPPPGQAPSPSPSASPGAQPGAPTPPITGTVSISGIANSFNDVNDFLLVLQKSDFLNPKETKLVSSELQKDTPTLKILQLQQATTPQTVVNPNNLPRLPKQVEFTIQTAFNDIPASDLLQALERKTAVGLVTRIEQLQRKGVIQK